MSEDKHWTRTLYTDRFPIPDGHRIFVKSSEPKGMFERKTNALKFAKAKEPWLEMELEPNNKYDSKAIKILGCVKGFLSSKKYHIGYLDKNISSAIYACQPIAVNIRLNQIYLNKQTEFVEIRFSITGPKEQYKKFKEV